MCPFGPYRRHTMIYRPCNLSPVHGAATWAQKKTPNFVAIRPHGGISSRFYAYGGQVVTGCVNCILIELFKSMSGIQDSFTSSRLFFFSRLDLSLLGRKHFLASLSVCRLISPATLPLKYGLDARQIRNILHSAQEVPTFCWVFNSWWWIGWIFLGINKLLTTKYHGL